MKSSRRLRWFLIAGLVGSNLLALLLSGYALHQSHQQFEQRAEVLSQNVASAVDQHLSSSIEKIDLALHTIADELERQLATGKGIDEPTMNAFIHRHEQRLPEVEAFRVAQADGRVILGKGLIKSEGASWADRDYFIEHRAQSDRAMLFRKPRLGRVAKRSIVNFSLRYNTPNGQFAGVISAPIAVDHFAQLLSRFDAGPNGTLVLRDAELGLIARFPSAPNQPYGQIGHNAVSATLRRLVESGAVTRTYHSPVTPDGMPRTLTFRRLDKAPMIVNVGIARQDFLAAWYKEVYQSLAMMLGLLLLSALSGGFLLRLLTQAERREKTLSLSEAELNHAQQVAHLGSFSWNQATGILQWSAEHFRLWGLEPHSVEASYALFIQSICPSDVAQTKATLRQARQTGGLFECELRVHWPDGSLHDIQFRGDVSLDLHGQVTSITGTVQDLTQQKQAEAELKRSETKFRTLYNSTGEAVWLIGASGFIDCNKVALEIFGCSDKDALYAKYPSDLSPAVQACGTDSQTLADQLMAAAFEKGRVQFEWTHKRLDTGETFPADVILSAMELDGQPLLQAVVRNIAERKSAENEIMKLAFYDPLTGLPNRRLMLDRLRQALSNSLRHQHHGAVMLLDLDNFKTLNDTLGHTVGDQLLQEVATRLSASIREGDTVARLGGDEFVVILENLDQAGLAALQAESVAQKILRQLSEPYLLNVVLPGATPQLRSHHCTSSIGIALFHEQPLTVDELVTRADTAMYQAKAAGRNTLRFFDPEMQAIVTARATLEADLREAIQGQQFTLYYQTQVTSDGRITGAEALVRWQHPQRGLVSPAEFIPMAEENGLILPLGQWVLETACMQLAQWATQPALAHLTIAVNVSAKQFHQAQFVDQVLAVLARSAINPQRLKLELTESLLLNDVDEIIVKMTTLRARGVRFSLDDFGTGYSSLSYLKRLPLDQLKIDQSFVRNILTDPNDGAIAQMVLALGQSLGLSVIAEGVETQAQRDHLYHQGCHAYQGYLFSRPLPIAAFERQVNELMCATV